MVMKIASKLNFKPLTPKPLNFTLYYIQSDTAMNTEAFDQMARKKGRFIIATNQIDQAKLSDQELFDGYKGQAKVERGFRFLKAPSFGIHHLR